VDEILTYTAGVIFVALHTMRHKHKTTCMANAFTAKYGRTA